MRPDSASCMKRRITFCPPVRSISTLMPVCFSNSLAICCPAATGVDVYQVTWPSRLAAASSTGSGLNSCAAAVTAHNALANSAAHTLRMIASRGSRLFATIADVDTDEQANEPGAALRDLRQAVSRMREHSDGGCHESISHDRGAAGAGSGSLGACR